jgi:glycosyltransferase involved in cell wall biosynthesis
MTTPLTWGLTIATYNRADCLRTCVALAVAQTRPPSEVVIVDASDDWSKARDTILSEIAADNPAVRWTYQQARVRSLTHQRNQALDQTTADVLFLIDDDSFMFDDCAAEIMAIYEADPEGKIAGVSATLADNAPGASSSPAREPVWRSALR